MRCDTFIQDKYSKPTVCMHSCFLRLRESGMYTRQLVMLGIKIYTSHVKFTKYASTLRDVICVWVDAVDPTRPSQSVASKCSNALHHKAIMYMYMHSCLWVSGVYTHRVHVCSYAWHQNLHKSCEVHKICKYSERCH